MTQGKGIIVGVLGQWASGKTTAARTLIDYLGGEEEVVFISDRVLLASQAVNHILELGESGVKRTIADDGRQRLEGERTTVWLRPGEDLASVDLGSLQFDLPHDVDTDEKAPFCDWLTEAKVELGRRICASHSGGKPVVIESGFGTNMEPRGERPFSHTIADLFASLEEGGAHPRRVGWIIVEAGYERRSARNRRRADSVPAVEFDRYAADGGDLDPAEQRRWEREGTVIRRVWNNHDDVERFRADVIAAFEEMFGGSRNHGGLAPRALYQGGDGVGGS
jgi:hypothetical protein